MKFRNWGAEVALDFYRAISKTRISTVLYDRDSAVVFAIACIMAVEKDRTALRFAHWRVRERGTSGHAAAH